MLTDLLVTNQEKRPSGRFFIFERSRATERKDRALGSE